MNNEYQANIYNNEEHIGACRVNGSPFGRNTSYCALNFGYCSSNFNNNCNGNFRFN